MTRRAPRGIYIALLPSFALLVVFNYWPIVSAFFHSFYRWDPGGVEEYTGLSNFARLVHDAVMWKAFANLALVMVANLTIKLAVPLAVAVLIFHLRREAWRYFYRVLFVIPMVVPAIVVILLWQFIYADGGLLTALLQALGLSGLSKGWLSNPQTALGALIGVGFPFVSGFALLVFYAGLLNIPDSLLESARLEGAGWWWRFWRIELPLLLGQMRVIVVLTMIGTMQGYELFLILTRGGPGYTTMVPGLWMYLCGFSFNEMGYACSIGVVLFLAMLGLTVLNLRFMKQEEIA
ncbi:MAG: sugar ABC transporter permease [bacterium]|nr:sugar ABC transporter permease [candidate division KSB1 bacterium]MDH7560718.1 sugar ABC transporter permease [bacterium]